MADLTVLELADAMQRAWNEFCADTGCIPSDFTIHGPSTTRVVADFGKGEFARMVFDELDRPAVDPQPAQSAVKLMTNWYATKAHYAHPDDELERTSRPGGHRGTSMCGHEVFDQAHENGRAYGMPRDVAKLPLCKKCERVRAKLTEVPETQDGGARS